MTFSSRQPKAREGNETFRRDKASAGEANCDRKLRESLISQGLAKGPLSVVFC